MDEILRQLVTRSGTGDQDAFRELIRLTSDYTSRIAMKYLGNTEEVQDVLQEVYLKTWKSCRRLNHGTSIKSWLFAVVRNQSIDHLRKQSRQTPMIPRYETSTSVNETANPLEHLELLDHIRKWILTLPRIQQKVFAMRDLESLSVSEVMENTGLSEGSIKTNLYLARKKLKEHLNRIGYEIKK
ncbi:MAG: RNA polymerase sigma factor [Bacteroidales bacterium]|nr:RNA polymerase sigma factor [Bacteroidales bacterium]